MKALGENILIPVLGRVADLTSYYYKAIIQSEIQIQFISENFAIKWLSYVPLFFRIVSLTCSPTGAAFVCSAAASKKSTISPLRLSQTKLSDMSSILTSTSSSSNFITGVLQCWDMKAMKVEVYLPFCPTRFSILKSNTTWNPDYPLPPAIPTTPQLVFNTPNRDPICPHWDPNFPQPVPSSQIVWTTRQ